MIIVKVQGGFGNQLFQYASGRALSLYLNTDLKLDLSFFDAPEMKKVLRLDLFNLPYCIASPDDYLPLKNSQTPALLKKVLLRLGIRIPPFFKSSHLTEEAVGALLNTGKINGDYYVDGWLANESYFVEIKDRLQKELDLTSQLNEQNKQTLARIDADNSVAVHIRRGDYLTNNYFKTLPLEYYNTAINEIKTRITNAQFWFFSDDVAWVKENFSNLPNAHFVEHNSTKDTTWSTKGDVEDMMLIKNCKHQVIANSSFSWWGAWLNKNPNKVVCYPATWYEDQTAQANFETNSFIPKSWHRIKF